MRMITWKGEDADAALSHWKKIRTLYLFGVLFGHLVTRDDGSYSFIGREGKVTDSRILRNVVLVIKEELGSVLAKQFAGVDR